MCPVSVFIVLASFVSQIIIELSPLPLAYVLVGRRINEKTDPVCPVTVFILLASIVSQILYVS